MSINFVAFQLILVAVIAFALPSNPKFVSVDKPIPMPLLYGDPTIIIDEESKEEGSVDPYLEYLREDFRRDRRKHFGFMNSDELYNAFPLPQPEFLG